MTNGLKLIEDCTQKKPFERTGDPTVHSKTHNRIYGDRECNYDPCKNSPTHGGISCV